MTEKLTAEVEALRAIAQSGGYRLGCSGCGLEPSSAVYRAPMINENVEPVRVGGRQVLIIKEGRACVPPACPTVAINA